MLTLFIKTIKKSRISLAIYSTIGIAFVWMYVAIFPSIFKEREKLREAFQAYPEGLREAFAIEIDTFVSSIEGFMAGEYFSLMWPIILIILIITFASAAIAGEIDKGTIELLLSQPISRLKIFFAKYFAGLTIITVFILLTNFAVVPLANLHNVDYKIQNFLTMSVLGFLFAFAVFGICMMISSFSSSRGRPAALTGGMLIIMYGLNLFSAFQESLDSLKYASFFHYFDFSAAIVHNQIDILNAMVFLAVGIVTAVMGAVIFSKRDIATT